MDACESDDQHGDLTKAGKQRFNRLNREYTTIVDCYADKIAAAYVELAEAARRFIDDPLAGFEVLEAHLPEAPPTDGNR